MFGASRCRAARPTHFFPPEAECSKPVPDVELPPPIRSSAVYQAIVPIHAVIVELRKSHDPPAPFPWTFSHLETLSAMVLIYCVQAAYWQTGIPRLLQSLPVGSTLDSDG